MLLWGVGGGGWGGSVLSSASPLSDLDPSLPGAGDGWVPGLPKSEGIPCSGGGVMRTRSSREMPFSSIIRGAQGWLRQCSSLRFSQGLCVHGHREVLITERAFPGLGSQTISRGAGDGDRGAGPGVWGWGYGDGGAGPRIYSVPRSAEVETRCPSRHWVVTLSAQPFLWAGQGSVCASHCMRACSWSSEVPTHPVSAPSVYLPQPLPRSPGCPTTEGQALTSPGASRNGPDSSSVSVCCTRHCLHRQLGNLQEQDRGGGLLPYLPQ